jgi:predicted PurR-regulated permease PerM
MEGCAVPSPIDMDELITKGYISKMLSDNYTLLIIFVIIIGILLFLTTYFINQIKTTLKDYNRNIQKIGSTINTEDEVYIDEPEVLDPNTYQDPNKQQFYKNVDTVYKEYNKEKTNYIKSTYNKENDDSIDRNIVYSKYDDYK